MMLFIDKHLPNVIPDCLNLCSESLKLMFFLVKQEQMDREMMYMGKEMMVQIRQNQEVKKGVENILSSLLIELLLFCV